MEHQPSIGAALDKPKEPVLLGIRDICEKYTKGIWKTMGTYVHPNQITSARLGIGTAALGLHATGQADLGTALFIANCAIDWVDGAVARATPALQTAEGAKLDPLVDKAVNGLSLAYMVSKYSNDIPLCIASGVSIAVDYISQRQRGPLTGQIKEGIAATLHPEACTKPSPQALKAVQANIYGKLKFFLQSAAIGTILFAGDGEKSRALATASLAVASGLGIAGTMKRKKS